MPRVLGILALASGCVAPDDVDVHALPIDAYCDVPVDGVGTLDVEGDYLPHVVQCENGGADLEALEAQAIAARSYLYYKLETTGSVTDGTGDQVYSCGAEPNDLQRQAVEQTSGLVLRYADVTVCAFYVAGADPGDRGTCVATDADADPTSTERFVTYNEGLSGDAITQTTLGWVDPGNFRNRGCQSQWGARCLEEAGYGYEDILHFYYGEDVALERAVGPCVEDDCVKGPEICDGIDNDCDGAADEDLGGEETCNCADDDCNGIVDDGAGACADVARLVASSWPREMVPGERTSAWAEWRNEGSEAWPASDVVAVLESGTGVVVHPAPLPGDVAPGETVRVDFSIEVPADADVGMRMIAVRLHRGADALGDPCDASGAWTLAIEIVLGGIQGEAGCSCRTASPAGPSASFVAFVALLVGRRRRRRNLWPSA